jgi:hypothetical protein
MGKKKGKKNFFPWIMPFSMTRTISIEIIVNSIMLKAHTYTLPKAKGVNKTRKMSPNSMMLSGKSLKFCRFWYEDIVDFLPDMRVCPDFLIILSLSSLIHFCQK